MYSELPETYVVPTLFFVIFLLGIVGNGCLIYIFSRCKAMRSLPNTYVFNLAIGDLLVLVCTVPFTSTVYTFQSWPFGEFVCKASEFAKDLSVGVSVFTLIALSYDRYIAIVRPIQSFTRRTISSRCVIISLAVIWSISLVCATPAALFTHLMPYNVTTPTSEADGEPTELEVTPIVVCYPFPKIFGTFYPKLVILLRVLLHYVLPLLVIGTLYVIMAVHLLRSTRLIPGQDTISSPESMSNCRVQQHSLPEQGQRQERPHTSQNEGRRRVAVMVLTIVVLFAICFLPSHIVMLWFYFNPDSQEQYNLYWHWFRIIGFVLSYVNSCINPIALYFVSSSFKKHFCQILCCCSKRVSSQSNTSQSQTSSTGLRISSS